ncbi:MAG TPA: hypothetical protein VIM65_15190 [Cyclobacteriaceae bacterium]
MKKSISHKKTEKKKGQYSKNIASSTKLTRSRDSIKFSRKENDNTANDKDSYQLPGYSHYGGDKYGSSVSNHSARNWGFATGFKNDDNAPGKKKSHKK